MSTGAAVVARLHPDSAGDFGGLGGGQAILPTVDPAGADLLEDGRSTDPVAQPVSDRGPAEVVAGQLEARADQAYGVAGEHRDEEVGADPVANSGVDSRSKSGGKDGVTSHFRREPFP